MSKVVTELTTSTPGSPSDPTARQRRNLRAPSMPMMMLEQRVMFEMGALGAAAPWLRVMGRGDRHPVLVLPGFMGDDASTVALRFFIRSWGYWSHGWGMGQNLGPTPDALQGINDRLEALYSRHGREVSLVGWSLGGLYARYLARKHPEWVRQVITLGSPIQMREGDRAAPSQLSDLLKSSFDPGFGGKEDYLQGPSARAVDDDLLAQRRRGPLAGVHRRRRRAARERRGHQQPRRPRLQPGSAVRRRRPLGPARGHVEAVRRAVPAAPAVPARGRRTTRKGAFGVAESPRRDRPELVDRPHPCDSPGAHVRAGWRWRPSSPSAWPWSGRRGPMPRPAMCRGARCCASPSRKRSAARPSSGN